MTTLRSRTIALRSRFILCLAAGALSLLFGAYNARSASAFTTATNCALPGSNFQGGDGDQTTPTLAEQTFCTEHFLPTTTDWQNLTHVVNSPDPQEPDDIFVGGNKETDPGNWGITYQAGGATPGKANIVSAWSQTEPEAAATFLYMSFEREATTGDTFLTFELNQVKGVWENENKATIPCRTTGDVLLAYNHGGSSVNIVFYRWVTDTSTPVTIPPNPTPVACAKTGHFEVAGGVPVESPNGQAALNATEITNYLTDTANPTPSKFAAGSFGEGSVNLTAIFQGAKLGSCFAFGQMWMSSRSSEAIDSQLQDYVRPIPLQADSCAISGRKFDDANGDGLDEPNKPGLGGWTIQLLNSAGTEVLRTTTTASDGSYMFTNVAPGSYLLREVGQTGWTCDYPGTGANCQHAVTLNETKVNSSGNDFGNHPTSTVVTTQEPASGTVGSKFGDSATVTGSTGAPTPTGSVEFRLYSDNHCGTLVSGPISEKLSGGKASIPSAELLAPQAGEYWWVASYGGDSYNAAAESKCADEPVTVNKATPSLKTTQAPASGTVGGVFKDKATVSGLFGATPGGTITWKLFDNKECKNTPVAEDSIAVTANNTYETPKGATISSVGTYYWVAYYSGDHNNAPAESGCAAEPVSVTPAGPAIETTQAPASGTVGGVFKDKATVSGLFGATPGGTITWKLFDNKECKNTPVAEDSIAVTANNTYETPTGATISSVGTYYWVAYYSGDHNNAPAESGCAAEPVSVTPAGPAIETTQAPASGTVGGVFKDKATVSGLFGATPGGTITWKLFDNKECKNTPVAEDSIAVTANNTYETPKGATISSVGTYYWVAYYSGDHNNAPAESGCAAEPVSVTPAGPAIETTQAPASGTVGGVFKDKATVSGLFGATPGGTITWKLFDNKECKNTPVAEDSIAVTANNTYETPKGATISSVGTYYWVAYYSGDHNNAPAESGCAAEPVSVTPAGPAIETTQAPASGTVGGVFKDKATVSGLFGATPGGTITWKLFDNKECKNTPVAEDSIAVTANNTYETPKGATISSVGTYYWVAYYSGDHNNAPAESGCAAEPVSVTPAGPAIETTQAPASGTVGGVFKDKATVSGLFGATPGGTITWKLFDNKECKNTPVAEDSIAVTANNTYETPTGATISSVGTYYWVAYYSGDHNNAPAESGCAAEPVSVTPAGPAIETTQAPASGTVGGVFKDKATVSGLFGATPGGTITWKLFDNKECKNTPVAEDSIAVTANNTYETPTGATISSVGTYYWVAYYSGDHNNAPAESGCAAEPVSVTPAGPAIETTQAPASGTVGGVFKDKATVSGLFGATPGGTITWKLFDNKECKNTPVAEDSIAVTANNTYETPKGATISSVGTYYWVAYYSGDHNNAPAESGCAAEPVSVTPAGPAIETTQAPASGTVGGVFKDKATVSGLFGATPGGTITWKLFDNKECKNTPVAEDSIAVTANNTYETPKGATISSVGTYYWVAYYSGDHNNAPAESGCAAEPVSVTPAGPAIETTQAPASGTVGGVFKDKATVSGLFGATPGGTITWKLFDNKECKNTPVAEDSIAVTANNTYETPKGATISSVGTYYWVAYYSGDHNNAPAESGCAAEPVSVTPAGPAIETTQAPASGTVGGVFKDKATVSGLFGATPGGTITWKLFDNKECKNTPVAEDSIAVTANNTYETPKGATISSVGTYYWVAYYSGDHNNAPAESGCAAEPVSVTPAGPAIETTQAPASGTVGGVFKDKATVSGLFGATPGGTITWKLFDNKECKNTPVAEDSIAVTANNTYETPTGATISSVGTYYWVAYYSGDHNNAPAESGCAAEPVSVTPAGPAIETTQAPASGTVGGVFKDKATVSGLFGATPGGTITWKLFDNKECKNTPVAEDSIAVTANNTYETPKGATISSVGTYYWVAYYSGDHNNAPAESGCAAEPVSVTPAGPAIETTQAPASGTVGGVFKDKATVSGLFGATPGGTITWKLFDNKECKNTPVAEDSIAVTANNTYETPTGATISSVGTYYWVAYYSGDHNNAPAESGCAAEPVSVTPAGPAIETTQAPASGTVGGVFKDKATVSGLFGATPGGTITWKLFDNKECKNTPVAEDSIAVTANNTYETPTGATISSVGTYYWVAYYSGDHNNAPAESGCAAEPVSVTPAGPAIETTQAPASGTVGGVFKDKATVSGLFGATPGGTITWKLFDNKECKNTPVAEDSIAVTANNTYETPTGATISSVGTYYWVAYYSGDHNNAPAESGCAAEPVSVTPAGPAIETTQAPASGTVGGVFKDKATVSGLFGATPGGTITWKLFDNKECKNTPVAEDSIAVTANNTYETPKGATISSVGTYYWVAYYSGDHNNAPAESGCAAEPVSVTPAGPAIETTQAPASGTVGGVFKDKATVSGLFGATPGGTITWKLFDNKECKNTPVAEDSIAVTANNTYETPKGATISSVGTYYWVAYYSGDHNNAPAESGCAAEPVSVTPAGPAIETTQAPASGTVGGVFKDKATVSGLFGATPGGTITWKLFDNKECKNTPVAEDSIAVTANNTYETPKGATISSVGTYYWVAYYSGDANNVGATSGCADEPISVKAVPVVVVLPEKVISGEAEPHGPAACLAQATTVYITGRRIVSATFYLDGHKVKTVRKPDKHGRYGIKISAKKIKVGAHRIKVIVTFEAGSQTAAKSLRILAFRCQPPQPKFTG